MAAIDGTSGNDTLTGTPENDDIDGKGGQDIINGGAGDDVINQDDYQSRIAINANISGGDGNDVIFGYATQASRTITGDAGNDRIYLGLFGTFSPHAFNVDAGTGDDLLVLGGGSTGSVLIMGDGNDRLIYTGLSATTATLGAGTDEVQIGFTGWVNSDLPDALTYSLSFGHSLTITDFLPGEDRLSFDFGNQSLPNWDGSGNPFASGALQLIQRGADTALVANVQFPISGTSQYDIVVFKNVSAASLTAQNLGGFDPGGTVSAGITLNGTAGDEYGQGDIFLRLPGLVGRNGPDAINGLGGSDQLFGLAGDDVLRGGEGDDILDGGRGNDTIYAGAGKDQIVTGTGSEIIYGEGGQDVISHAVGELYTRVSAQSLIDGGDDGDVITVTLRPGSDFAANSLLIRGGDGDDGVFISTASTSDSSLNGKYYTAKGSLVDITLGAGLDRLQFSGAFLGTSAAIVVRDFTPGTDTIDSSFWNQLPLTNYTTGSNPYADGHAKLVQEGSDVVLYLDINGGGNGYFPSIRFDNTQLAQFSATSLGQFDFTVAPLVGSQTVVNGTTGNDIFMNGVTPAVDGQTRTTGGQARYVGGAGDDTYIVDNLETVTELTGEGNDSITLASGSFGWKDTYTLPDNVEQLFVGGLYYVPTHLVGNSSNNRIFTGNSNDIVEGLGGDDNLQSAGGDDVLDGGSGNDFMAGGLGNDRYLVSEVQDSAVEGANEGTDLVEASVSYTLSDNLENLTLSAGGGAINATGNALDNIMTGNESANMLAGNGGRDILSGGLGNDTLDGGSNVDTAVVSGNRSAYTVTQTSTGNFQIVGPDGTDSLSNIEYLQFADQTIRLLPGTGTTVDFAGDPASFMASIRDFDGNDLGGASVWKRIGAVDVNGDGDTDQIFVNPTIGRFAELATAADGKVYFSDHGWAGETRVVGIYVDPLVQSGEVVAGSDFDSQRRFQNDLRIDNLGRVLGGADYDRDGSQEVYFKVADGTAYLHAYMHADGNIQYANYQTQTQVIDFLTQNGWAASTYDGWFS